MTKALKIKGLLVSIGYAESSRTTVMPVTWTGRPFADAREAVRSFAAALLAACVAPAPKAKPLAACCVATKAAKPKAKACPDCGRSFAEKEKRTPDADPGDLLHALWSADCDGWNGAVPKWLRDDEGRGDDPGFGGWRFFGGFPADCDVVEVDRFDALFQDYGSRAAEFRTLHVGKWATRASSHGRITADGVTTPDAKETDDDGED